MDLTLLLHTLARIDDPTVNNTLLGVMGLREKIQALHTIGFKRAIDKDWYEQLARTLNLIDNELRPERNRMIHDFWIDDLDGELRRMRLNPKVVNQQSRTKRTQLSTQVAITPETMSLLCTNIESASVAINLLRHEYELRRPSPQRTPPKIPKPNPDQG